MRVISGERRGHKLYEFSGENIRPTTDRVKESLFNLIQDYVADAVVLDLFCGSGALSMEALSRGALRAVCVDVDRDSIKVIKKNVQELRYEQKCDIVNCDYKDYLSGTREKFDIIFLDPPYNRGFVELVLESIIKRDILSSGGIVVLESDDTDFHGDFEGFSLLKQRKYGRTFISVYTAKESD